MKIYILVCVLVASVIADVSHISNEYLPPTFTAAASAPVQTYSAPVSAPSYTAPEQSFDVAVPSVLAEPEYAASEPVASHSFSSSDGYRYKTQRRVVYRHRQRRGAPSTEYLPPAASSPYVEYLSPDASPAVSSYSVAPSYQSETYAPAASYQSESYAEPSYAESAPAHSFSSNDGYRYKTARRRVYRRRRY